MNPDSIFEIMTELLSSIEEKTTAVVNTHSTNAAINMLLNLGVQVMADGLSLLDEDNRMMPFISAIKAIVEESNLRSAHIDTNILLQDIMRKK